MILFQSSVIKFQLVIDFFRVLIALFSKNITSYRTYHLEIGACDKLNNSLCSFYNRLQNLSLRNNLITEIGALNIAFSLSKFQSSSIVNLNLSFNKLGDEGAKHIAKVCFEYWIWAVLRIISFNFLYIFYYCRSSNFWYSFFLEVRSFIFKFELPSGHWIVKYLI